MAGPYTVPRGGAGECDLSLRACANREPATKMAKNHQHAAVLKNVTATIDAVHDSATITTLAGELLREGLIAQQIHDSEIGDRNGPAKILAAVQGTIKEKPERFDDFLKCLKNSELEEIAEKLESDYREFSILLA